MPLSEEEIQSIIEALKPIMTETANQAAAAHITKRNKAYDDKLEERLSKFQSTPVEEEPEKVTLTQRQSKTETEVQNLKNQLKAERESNQRLKMRSDLETQLTKGGIPQKFLKSVIAQLIHEDKLVELGPDGKATFKVNSEYGEENLSIEEGMPVWLKGEGKNFIEKPSAKGAGLRSQKSNHVLTREPAASQEEADTALMDLIRQGR